jgi:glycosyltransferase involved in cell wall biosynthesis
MSRPAPSILSVIHYPGFGGPHGRNLALARYFAARGTARLSVLLPAAPGDAAGRLRAAGVEVLTAPLGRLRASRDPRVHLATAAGWPGDVARIAAAARQVRADAVLLNGLANPQAALAARRAGAALVWQLLDTRTPRPLARLLRPWVRRADAVMATGRRVADLELGSAGCAALGPRLVTFVPPVDVARWAPDPEAAAAARAELGLGDAPVVGAIANLTAQKGHRAFLAAAARLRARRPQVRFLWLGRPLPGQRAYADALLAEAAALGLEPGRGLVLRDPGDRLPQLAQALDLAWLTSPPASEGIPTAVMEAMALAKPLVGFDVGGLRDLVPDAAAGRLVPPGDVAALVDATDALLADAGARAALGAAARARIVALGGIAACAEAHLHAVCLALWHRERAHAPA